MRVPLNKLLERLGVGYVLSPYETCPWVLYDETRKITCSAEVRMGTDGRDIEAEIQFLYDEDDEGGSETGGGDSFSQFGKREQILWMRAEPYLSSEWSPKYLRIKGKDYVNAFHDWEGKGCDFFLTCVESLKMGTLPEIDTLIEQKMQDDEGGGAGKRGRVGRKAPKINPSQLMGMKK